MKNDIAGEQTEESGTGKIIIHPYDDPISPYTKGKDVKPEEKSAVEDTYHARIVVVGPYSQFNVYLESTIPSLVKGSFVDFLDRADISLPPYIDVEKREKAAEQIPEAEYSVNREKKSSKPVITAESQADVEESEEESEQEVSANDETQESVESDE